VNYDMVSRLSEIQRLNNPILMLKACLSSKIDHPETKDLIPVELPATDVVRGLIR
jgi:hypothetical protein